MLVSKVNVAHYTKFTNDMQVKSKLFGVENIGNDAVNSSQLEMMPAALSFKARLNKASILSTIKNEADLYAITSDTAKSEAFIAEITSDARKSREITAILLKKAGGKEAFQKWYFAPNGYKEAYSNYVENLVANAEKPEDLLKISPNWYPWVLKETFGKDYTFGQLPESFDDLSEYRATVKTLLGNESNLNAKEFGGGVSGKRAFLLDIKGKKYVLKVQGDYLVYSQALREALEKDDWLEDSFFKNYKDNESLKSDSCFLNAMIDSYLNLNNSHNAVNMHFYDPQTASVLYEYAGDEKYEGDIDILSVNKVLPDLNALGIIYNDASVGNLRVKNNEIIIIDSGESNFIDILKPTVPGFQFELPNFSGNSLVSFSYGLATI